MLSELCASNHALSHFDSHEKCESFAVQCKAGRPIVRMWQKLNIAVFSETVNMINVKLCMVVVLTEFYPFIPLSVTLSVLVPADSPSHGGDVVVCEMCYYR